MKLWFCGQPSLIAALLYCINIIKSKMEIRGVNNATATEVGRLFPKIYIIVFSPERSAVVAECMQRVFTYST